MIIKYNDFLYIFYSSFRMGINYIDLDELWKLFCHGEVWYDFEKFITIPTWHRWLDKRIYPTGRGNEDSAHATLKALIKNHLDKKQIKYYGPEIAFEGSYPDVLTKDLSLVFECGDTDPYKVLSYLSRKEVKRVSILPYPCEEGKWLYIHHFRRGKGFWKYIEEKQKELREAHRKYHRGYRRQNEKKEK